MRRAVPAITVVVLVSLAATGFAVGDQAGTDQPAWADEYFEKFERIADAYNENPDRVDLGPFDGHLHDVAVNVHVTDVEGNTATYSFQTDSDGHIMQIRQSERDDATVTLETTRTTLAAIANSDDHRAALRRAIVDGDVVASGPGLTTIADRALVDQYEQFLQEEAGTVVRTAVANTRVNVYVTESDGSRMAFSFRIDEQMNVVELSQHARADANLEVLTDRETVEEIARADDRRSALVEALREDDLRLHGIGLFDQLKWSSVEHTLELLG